MYITIFDGLYEVTVGLLLLRAIYFCLQYSPCSNEYKYANCKRYENQALWPLFVILQYFLWIHNEDNNFDDATSEFFYEKWNFYWNLQITSIKKICMLFIMDTGILVLLCSRINTCKAWIMSLVKFIDWVLSICSNRGLKLSSMCKIYKGIHLTKA